VTPAAIEPAVPADVDAIERLLAANHLPTANVREWIASALVARQDARIVGCAALEIYSSGVLLRSVVVDEAVRGSGLGQSLTASALSLARSRRARAAYLLTTTAGEFFPRFGFTKIERADVPEDVRQSIEFTSACPASALVMRVLLAD
jgi:amino-acid N-acetyltransferase